MRLTKTDEPHESVVARELDPASYFNALVDHANTAVADTDSSPDQSGVLKTIFRDASRRAAVAFSEARQRLAA